MRKFTIDLDCDLAEKITVEVLIEYRDSLIKNLNDHFDTGSWMHPEDITRARAMIPAINFVLKDFGV
jgi:hypothetical protein